MTTQAEMGGDPLCKPVLDHGFVRLVDSMGSDHAIVEAARVSYGAGTKTVNEDRGLIRYLMRMTHTSPFEMGVVKFHMKMPIFVARQFVRHRTHAMNEYSGRYSVMPDEFYMPKAEDLKPQSTDNRQGRSGELDDISKNGIQWIMQANQEQSYELYRTLLGEKWINQPFDPYDTDDPLLTDEFPGVTRELARIVLPLSNYTEFYWTQNLHNLFHLIKLRYDAHAQHEIRVYAKAMFDFIQPLFPVACEAFVDFVQEAVNVSRMERELIQNLLSKTVTLDTMISAAGGLKPFANDRGLSVRELREFAANWGLVLPEAA